MCPNSNTTVSFSTRTHTRISCWYPMFQVSKMKGMFLFWSPLDAFVFLSCDHKFDGLAFVVCLMVTLSFPFIRMDCGCLTAHLSRVTSSFAWFCLCWFVCRRDIFLKRRKTIAFPAHCAPCKAPSTSPPPLQTKRRLW